ncbi:MAG: hypothetical protein GY751_19110 [Bacteroidetes bacterium]|nr:hypothetical protein [Bacteroidota bacterium]
MLISFDAVAEVELVQTGSTMLSNGSSSITVNLPSTVLDSKTMLIVTAAPSTAATNGPEHTNVLSQLNCSSGTCSSIRIARHGTLGDIQIGWKIIEFTALSDVTVYRGTIMHGQINKNTLPDTETISIGTRVATSFVLLSDLVGGVVTTWDDTVDGEIDSNGDLVIRIGNAKSTGSSLEGEVAYRSWIMVIPLSKKEVSNLKITPQVKQ